MQSQNMTVGRAIDAIDVPNRDGEEIILVNFVRNKPKHRVVDDALRAEPLAPDTYIATGRFIAGRVRDGRGRSGENVASIYALAIDCDLKDKLGLTSDQVVALDDKQLDHDLGELLGEVTRLCNATGLRSNYIVATGHGFALWYMLADEEQDKLDRARAVFKRLVAALNHAAGWTIADKQVSDAGTRIMRLPGAPNTKGGKARPTILYDGEPNWWTLDALESLVAAIEPDEAPAPSVVPSVSRMAAPVNSSPFDLDAGAANEIVDLVRPYWLSGQRHALALGLAGWLKRNGVSRSTALSIVEGCAAGSDDERDDRIKAVETTYARSDSAVVGWTTIRDLLPSLTVRRVDDLLSAFWRARQRAAAPVETEVVMSGGQSPTITAVRERSAEAAEDEAARAIEYTPLPESIFQGALAEYVDIMKGCTEAPIQFHVGAFLAANGALAGRAAYTPYASKMVYANQYVMLVGSSGTSKKDTAIRFATEKFAGLEPPFDTVLRTRERWSRLDDAGSDVALLKHLKDHPNTLLVVPELHAQIAKMRSKGRESLFDTMLTLWDANARYQNVTMATPLLVENPTLSVLAGIQPTRLRNIMNEEILSSGFVNRWLIVPGEATSPLHDPPSVSVEASRSLMAEIIARYDDIETMQGRDGPLAIPFSADCSAIWKNYYERAWYARKRDPDAGDLTGRYPDLVRKVALTLALTDLSRAMPREIEWQHVTGAMDLIQWQEDNVGTLRREWGGTDETRIEARILAALDNPKHRLDESGNARAVRARKLKQLTYIKGVPTAIWNRALASIVKSGEVVESYPAGAYELAKYVEQRKAKEAAA